MNEQEMQFADPDWQPRGSLPLPQEDTIAGPSPIQPVNNSISYDISQDAGVSSYEQGYRGSPQRYSSPYNSPVAQQMPVRQVGGARRRSGWWIWLIIIIVVISMISSMSHSFNRSQAFPGGQGPGFGSPPGFTYALKGESQLAINDSSGSITVRVEDGDRQEVTVESDNNSGPDVGYTAGGMTINSTDDGDITVIVPQGVTLSINAATIEVDGFTGQLSAQTSSDSITLNNDTLSGQSSITSQSGDISLNQVALSGQVTVATGGSGGIEFNGTLDPNGTYQFTTDNGNIDLTLPADTAMQVSSTPGTGTFQSDFANPTGNGPRAGVTVRTNSGDIGIHQR